MLMFVKMNYDKTNDKLSRWQHVKRNAGSSMSSKPVLMKCEKTDCYKSVSPLHDMPASIKHLYDKRKRTNNISTVLSKPKQKKFRNKTHLQQKLNIASHSKSCFPALKRRLALNKKPPLLSSQTSDSSQKRMYQASPPLFQRQWQIQENVSYP